MPGEVADRGMTHAKDFLLEEYRNVSDCFWKNEQSGETRVNLFIGFAGAAIGGLVTLSTAEHGPKAETFQLVFIASLVALIVLGIVILFRMLKRNAATDAYKRGSQMVRQIFKDHFDDSHIMLDYYPFAAPTDRKEAGDHRSIGGLAHTVAVINSLLAAGLAGAILFPVPVTVPVTTTSFGRTYAGSAASFCLALVMQFLYVDRYEKGLKRRHRETEPTHAGGIVFRMKDATVHYLLVGPSKENSGEWLLPKGHIEPGEGHGEAALREVREETGVVARLLNVVGRVEFDAPAKEKNAKSKKKIVESVRAKYYLMQALLETTPAESRRRDWFTFTDAHGRLRFENDRRLLSMAEILRTRQDALETGTDN